MLQDEEHRWCHVAFDYVLVPPLLVLAFVFSQGTNTYWSAAVVYFVGYGFKASTCSHRCLSQCLGWLKWKVCLAARSRIKLVGSATDEAAVALALD